MTATLDTTLARSDRRCTHIYPNIFIKKSYMKTAKHSKPQFSEFHSVSGPIWDAAPDWWDLDLAHDSFTVCKHAANSTTDEASKKNFFPKFLMSPDLILKWGHLFREFISVYVTSRLRQLSDTHFCHQLLSRKIASLSSALVVTVIHDAWRWVRFFTPPPRSCRTLPSSISATSRRCQTSTGGGGCVFELSSRVWAFYHCSMLILTIYGHVYEFYGPCMIIFFYWWLALSFTVRISWLCITQYQTLYNGSRYGR